MQIPLQITMEGRPCRRRAGVRNPKDRIYDVHALAQHALNHLEMDTVLQAVGRVRPYTKPREIITFQGGDHPKIKYTEEFASLGAARDHFNIPSKKEVKKTERYIQIQQAKAQGFNQRETADRLGMGLRTIKRYWNQKVPQTLINNIL